MFEDLIKEKPKTKGIFSDTGCYKHVWKNVFDTLQKQQKRTVTKEQIRKFIEVAKDGSIF